jgi:hypothetical protein
MHAGGSATVTVHGRDTFTVSSAVVGRYGKDSDSVQSRIIEVLKKSSLAPAVNTAPDEKRSAEALQNRVGQVVGKKLLGHACDDGAGSGTTQEDGGKNKDSNVRKSKQRLASGLLGWCVPNESGA